jgi:hypothetical protein
MEAPPLNGKGAPGHERAPHSVEDCQNPSGKSSLTNDRGNSKKKRKRSDPDRIRGVRRKNVERVIRHRYGGLTLPDDYDGRAAAQLLLELGTDGVTIQHIAPWATGEALADLIRRADGNYAYWSKREAGGKTIKERIGERLELTFEEFKACALTHVWPADVDCHVVQIYQIERKRQRSQRYKDKHRKPRELSERATALLRGPLSLGHEISVRKLAEHATEHLAAFADLDLDAGRQAVLRAVRELLRRDLVVTRNSISIRKARMLFVRLTDEQAEAAFLDIITCEDNDAEIKDSESDRGRPPRGAPPIAPHQAADEDEEAYG